MQRILLTLSAVALLVAAQYATADTLVATANEGIFTRTPTVSDPATNGQWCNFNTPSGASVGGMMMFLFDLTSYAGQTVLSDATMTVDLSWSQPGFVFTFGCHQVLSNWTEAVTSWDNFIGTISDDYTLVIGPQMSLQGFTAGGFYDFAVDQAVVQYMIDNPAQNYGLALVGSGNPCVRSLYNGVPGNRPVLTFALVPEPVLVPIIGALVFWAYRRMR